ncbi:MAG: TIGR03619 family F420-dependent LLM class oxidoreductase [Pseudomonadota bacterium]
MKIGISLPVRELKDDLGAIREFAQAAEELGLNHLRIPDQVIRKNNGHLHDPMMLLAYLAAVTKQIELVPSVIVLPLHPTALFARQAAELQLLSEGRLRLGIGVGKNAEEYAALGVDFHRRGRRVEEQMMLLRALWTEPEVTYSGEWDTIDGLGINPRPSQSIPMWIGASGVPKPHIARRIGHLADGWFVLCSPDEYPGLSQSITAAAREVGRDPDNIGTEAGVAVVGPREHEWETRVEGWRATGLTHLCLRTLGGDLEPHQHLGKMQNTMQRLATLS